MALLSNPATNGQRDVSFSRSENPFLFIVGCPRSGTTMLKRMVNAHPLVAITRETHWIPRYYKKQRGVTAEGLVTDRIVENLFAYHRFSQMKISRESLDDFLGSRSDLRYADLVSHIFDHYGRRKRKPLVGDKTPTYVRKLPTLHALWPRTQILHLIRDGRDVWLSMRQWRMSHKAAGKFSTWQIDPLVTTALWWKALVAMGRRDAILFGEKQYREVRYDALVAQPEVECRRIADFLGVSHVEAMERFYEGRTKTDSELSTNAAWLPPTPGRRDWRTQMADADIEKFEAAAGDLLDDLGFERVFPTIPNRVRRHVEKIKRSLANEISGRWQLPSSW